MEEMVQGAFENYPVLGTILGGLIAAHAFAMFIVNLTPTPADNTAVAKVYKVVEWVAGVTNRAKEKGDQRW